MFKLLIRDLELYAYHGVYDFEKAQGQPFLINCEIGLALAQPIDDELAQTISYVDCLELIKAKFLAEKYDLVEYAAQVIVDALFDLDPRVVAVDLRIEKTQPPVDDQLGSLGISLCRTSS